MLDCTATLIGITDKDCACLAANRPTGWNVSSSGLYLTDERIAPPLLSSVYNSLDCGDGDFWPAMTKILKKARQQVEDDLQIALATFKASGLAAFNGTIAKREATNARTVTATKAGVQLRPFKRKDASFVLTAIHTGFDSAATFPVTIESDNPEFTTQTLSVESVAGEWKRNQLLTPVTMPFHSKQMFVDNYGNHLKYNVTYTPNTARRPFANTFYCCSYKPSYMNFTEVGGIETKAYKVQSRFCGGSAMGLVLEGYVTCDNLQWVCELTQLGGLQFKPLIAKAIQYQGVIAMIGHILKTENSNIYTAMTGEALTNRAIALSEEYQNDIDWIAQKLPPQYTGCYKCNPSNIKKVSL